MWVYFDASVLVKRYTHEGGTLLVNEIFQYLPLSQMTCLGLGLLEIVSILVRKRNDGRLSQRLFQQAMINFRTEIVEHEQFSTMSVDDALLALAMDLIVKHNLNAIDAVILRSALNLQQILHASGDQLLLWTSDKRLVRAAQNEGLMAFDPEVETMSHLHQLLSIS